MLIRVNYADCLLKKIPRSWHNAYKAGNTLNSCTRKQIKKVHCMNLQP